MNNNSTILETKLKRHKISYSNENGKIIIGKSKNDYTILIGLVVSPMLASIGLLTLIILSNVDFIGNHFRKVIIVTILLFGTGLFYLNRFFLNKKANGNLKVLDYKTIKIKNKLGEQVFNSRNIKKFKYTVKLVKDEIYEGNLYLVDRDNNEHQILRFDEDSEEYAINDLKWISEYLTTHTQLHKN